MARQERSAWLVSYDISDPKRLRRAAQILESHGIRLQNSVFLGLWLDRTLEAVCRDLVEIIHAQKDDLRLYKIPERCQPFFAGISALPAGTLLADSRFHLISVLHEQGAESLAERIEQERAHPS